LPSAGRFEQFWQRAIGGSCWKYNTTTAAINKTNISLKAAII
tara:strand:+ start:295 stop:420 length:126 start_codon:yes stop_codon:yes gene_type:complete